MTMKNTAVIAIVLVALVVGGYVAYSNFSRSNSETISGTKPESMTNEDLIKGDTFASLLARKMNLKCTFEHNDGTNVSSGTVYLADGSKRISGDFTIQQSGASPMEAHVIRSDGYNHMWGDFNPQSGVKTKISKEEENKLFSTKDGGGIAEDTIFDCVPWSVDESKFAIPSNITFMDVSAQMEQVNTQLDNVRAQQCAACLQAPEGTPREQCLTAMKCN